VSVAKESPDGGAMNFLGVLAVLVVTIAGNVEFAKSEEGTPSGRCYDYNFLRKNCRFFKPNVMYKQIFAKTNSSLSKKRHFFGKNIFKIITLVPELRPICRYESKLKIY
jgi:hypothetical protein